MERTVNPHAIKKTFTRLFAPVVQVVFGSTRWFFQPIGDNAQHDDHAGVDWQFQLALIILPAGKC